MLSLKAVCNTCGVSEYTTSTAPSTRKPSVTKKTSIQLQPTQVQGRAEQHKNGCVYTCAICLSSIFSTSGGRQLVGHFLHSSFYPSFQRPFAIQNHHNEHTTSACPSTSLGPRSDCVKGHRVSKALSPGGSPCGLGTAMVPATTVSTSVAYWHARCKGEEKERVRRQMTQGPEEVVDSR